MKPISFTQADVVRASAVFLILVCSALAVSAQKRIDAVADKFENSKQVESTFSERRDPETKKVTRISRIISFESENIAQQFQRAFEDERKNSIEATKTGTSYTLKFLDNDVEMTYLLTKERGNKWTFVYRMDKASQPRRRSKSKNVRTRHTYNYNYDSDSDEATQTASCTDIYRSNGLTYIITTDN